MDAGDLDLFQKSLARATTGLTGEPLDAALVDLGWSDAFAADPQVAVSVLFELLGAAPTASSALQHVFGAPLVGDAGAASPVLPALGGWAPPGVVEGAELTVAGLGTAALAADARAAVVALDGGELVAAVVSTGDLTLRSVSGVDPGMGLVEVTGRAVPVVSSAPCSAATWGGAVATGQRALAHELVGASRAMLGLAREHAVERIQFGVPISSFQAVRHRLAESLVAVEGARGAVDAAWDDGTPLTAGMAKAIAGRSARTVARHSQQVLAGIGFTSEHAFHHYLRRVLVLDQLLGSSKVLTQQLGQDLLHDRQLPSVLPL